MTRLHRLRRYLAGDAPAVGVDEQRPVPPTDDRLAGPVAVVIAIATLIAAVAAFQQADTSELADDNRLEATRLGLQAAASAQRGQQEAQVEYQTYVRSVEQRTAAGNALLRALYAEVGSAEARRLELEQQRWESLAETTAGASEIEPDAEFGPQRDALFPSRYFASAARESHELNALQDFYNEQADLLDERSAAYTAILAVLAVAVYLLGLTLAVREHLLRRAFLALGVALMLVAGAWTTLTAVLGVPDIREEAAKAYGAARVEIATAYDSSGYARAKQLYDEVIALRPSYGRAYLERAEAIILGATPQRSGLVSLVPAEALREAQADVERAIALGADPADAHGRLGFYAFLEGVQTGDVQSLQESVAASRRAIEVDPGQPVYRLNLAVALVALERHAEATAAYTDAIRHILFVEGDTQRPLNEPALAQQLLAGALTDLEVVARHRPDLADQVQAFKNWLVGHVAAETLDGPPLQTDVTVSDVSLDVFPGKVQWQARLEGYDPATDVVSVQWYRAAPGTDEVAIIPEISSSVAPFPGDDGRHGVQTPYLGVLNPPACLPNGTYRAEIYVNGVRLASEEVVADFGALEATALRDVTIAFCRPSDWQPVADAVPGMIRGYTGGDGERGIYTLRMAMPRSFTATGEITPLVIDIAMTSFADLFPAMPTFMEDEGTTAHDFIALQQPAWRWYDYGTGYVRVAAGLTDDGAVMMAMAYGPYDWFTTTDEPDTILNSMVFYE